MAEIFLKKRKGMTLIELIVSIGILGIVTTGLSTFFVYMWKSRFDEVSRGQSMLTASQSILKMSESIRKASQADSGSYAISSAGDFELIFYSDVDGDGNRERVHYYLEGNSIMMGKTEPILGDNPTYPLADEEIAAIADNVMNGPSDPIFTYYSASGNMLTSPIAVSSIRRIGLNVAVNVSPGRVSDTVISTSISLRNLNK